LTSFPNQTKKVSEAEAELLRKYRTRPDLFMREVLGFNPWEKQVEIAYSVRNVRETFVPSCNGAGKTKIAAAIVLWWLLCMPNSKVLTTAPTWRQVSGLLWANIRQFVEQAPVALGLHALQTSINLGPNWFALGASTNDPSKLQGYHGNVLVIVDEACGLGEDKSPIWEAIQGNLTGNSDRLLAIGNPTDPATEFKRRCDRPMKGFRNVIPISVFMTPNLIAGREVIKGAPTSQWVEEQRLTYGEDSPFWKARILGEFPLDVNASLFPLAWLDRSFGYDEVDFGKIGEGIGAIGFDVGGSGADNNALCYRTGGKVWKVHGWQSIDTTTLVDELYENWVAKYMPDVVTIDAVGVGKPIYDSAKKRRTEGPWRGVRVRPFIAQGKPGRDDLYSNRKAEAYVNFRELLRKNQVDMSRVNPEMRTLIEKQANAIRYQMDTHGRWKIEDKRTMRSREGFSPDELEAVIMAFSVREAKISADAVADYDHSPATRDDIDEDYVPGGLHVAGFDYDMARYERV
jgi:phage terminase large subunit